MHNVTAVPFLLQVVFVVYGKATLCVFLFTPAVVSFLPYRYATVSCLA